MANEENTDKGQEQKHPGGRPTLFREIFVEQAYKLAILGAIDKELANFFNVAESTINLWKLKIPEFSESIKRSKMQADTEVAYRLYMRAKGYDHPETKVFCKDGKIITYEVIKHYPPETAAIAFWLKNRQPKIWRDNHDFTSSGEKIKPQIVTFLNVTKIDKKTQAKVRI